MSFFLKWAHTHFICHEFEWKIYVIGANNIELLMAQVNKLSKQVVNSGRSKRRAQMQKDSAYGPDHRLFQNN